MSQSVADLQVRSGTLPPSARLMLDVGPSYVVAPALVLGIRYGSTPGRVLCGLCFALLAPHLFVGLTRLEVSAVGHVVAIGVALLVGPSWSPAPVRWAAAHGVPQGLLNDHVPATARRDGQSAPARLVRNRIVQHP